MSVIASCARMARGLADDAREAASFWEKTGRALKVGVSYFDRGTTFLNKMGPAGMELARQHTTVARRALRRAGHQQDAALSPVRGLSKAERIQAAQLTDDIDVGVVLRKVGDASRTMRKHLDMDMNDASEAGSKRTVGPGKKLKTRGSGRAFPTKLNAKGRNIVELAAAEGKANPKVQAFLEQLVAEKRYPDMDTALFEVRKFQEHRLRGTNNYLESVRFDLSPEYREWDPLEVLPDTFYRNAAYIEGIRRWGLEFEALRPIYGLIQKQGGNYGKWFSQTAEDYIKVQYGVGGLQPPWTRHLAGAVGNYENATKLSGIFSPIRQWGQAFVNAVDAPISSVLRGVFRQVTPWLQSTQQLRKIVERSGAISGFSSMTDFASGDKTAFRRFTEALLTPFTAAIRSSEYTSAIIARHALEADIEALVRVLGTRGSHVSYALESLRNASLFPDRMLTRRIGRRTGGVDPLILAEKWKNGTRFTPAELDEVMQRATEDDQFVMNLITEPVFWRTHPVLRLAFKLKPFGINQTRLVYQRVLKEAAMGNPTPAAKLIVAAAVLGEVWYLAKDAAMGSDMSATSLALSRDPSKLTAGELAHRIGRDVIGGGGVGLLADLGWGLQEYVAGPAGSTAVNLTKFVARVWQDPSQTALAARALAEDEVVLVPQLENLFEQAMSAMTNDGTRFREYNRLRGAAWAFRNAKESTSLKANIQVEVKRALTGPIEYEETPRTLRYRYAAMAVTANEPGKASEYLSDIFERQAETKDDLDELEAMARASMNRNAPLGQLSEDARDEFLDLLTDDQKDAAEKLREDWIEDYENAIDAAVKRARAKLRGSR